MKWTAQDVRRVRAILDHIAAKTEGGQTAFAAQIGVKGRQNVGNWRRRGRVPQAWHAAVIAAAAPEMIVTPAMLDPTTRAVVAHLNATPVRVREIEEAADGR